MTNTPEAPRPFAIALPIRVQSYDIDFAGIVSNIVYIRWLEDLRLKWLEEYLPLKLLMEQRTAPILISTYIEYHRPIRMFDDPVGHLWVSDLGESRWEIMAEFVVNGEITTTAKQTGVLISLETMRPTPIPGDLRAQFDALMGRAS